MEQKMMLSYGSLQIPCVLNAPDEEEVRRIVLGVHGLGGCTTDEIQSNLAEEMVFFESAMLRFDFPAHGESPHGSDDLTLENCVDSLLTVVRKAQSLYLTVEPRIVGIWRWFKIENLTICRKTYTVYYDEDGSVFGKGAGVIIEPTDRA